MSSRHACHTHASVAATSQITARLLACMSAAPAERALPPCWLEHGVVRHANTKMALSVVSADGRPTSNLCNVDTWTTIDDLTKRALKQMYDKILAFFSSPLFPAAYRRRHVVGRCRWRMRTYQSLVNTVTTYWTC
jgi:hypothetical protein